MPRITLSRVLGLVPLTWACLVATWFFLPSPVVPDHGRIEYIRQQLLHRRAVTTIVEFGDSFKKGRNWGNSCGSCTGLILDWQIESHYTSDSLILHIGQGRVNLTDAALSGPKAEKTAEPHTPYLGPSFKAAVRGGGTDHETALPWFRWTDKVLIDWTMHTGYVDVNLRVFSPEPGVVEIWKDISMWETYQPGTPVRETEREVGLMARFAHIPTAQFSAASLRARIDNVELTTLQGQPPSKSWPIRSIIAGPLYVPTFMLSVIMWSFTWGVVPLSTVLVFQMLCVMLIFVRFERFNISPSRWCCRERSKRPKERGIWGAAGPISDEESGLLAIRPQKPIMTFPTISKPSRSRAPVFDKM